MLYIHQFPDWTNFRFNFQKVSDALGEARLLEGKLMGIATLLNKSDTRSLAEDIVANFQIDETELDLEFVQAEIQKKNSATSAIRNFVGAILNANQPLTVDRLFAWHAAIGQNKVKKFREKETFGVAPSRIEHEMDKFLLWFEASSQDGLLKAAIAQFWFLTIHPFDDGNGKIARALSAMLIAKSEMESNAISVLQVNFSLCSKMLQNRDEYLGILTRSQSGNGDLTEWILWFIRMFKEAIQESLQNISSDIQTLQFSQKCLNYTFSPREKQIVDAAHNGSLPQPFSVKEAAALSGVSHDSALRDIQSLISKGIVQAEKKGGRSQKYTITP